MVAGGSPSSADCRYTPRSAVSILCGSKSLPTMCTDKDELSLADSGGAVALSAMPPFRAADLPFPFVLPPFVPLPLFPLVAAILLNASQTAIAMVYVSSPVEQPALQIRSGVGPSTDLRAHNCGTTCRARALRAPGWRKNPVLILSNPSSRAGKLEGSCSEERKRSSRVAEDPRLCNSI